MTISPETLMEESLQERRAREAATGVLGNGLVVLCHPVAEDPEITQQQDRVVCMHRPYPTCGHCAHSRFTLFFDADPASRLQIVWCPRWESEGDRQMDKDPLSYVPAEIATCDKKPYEFCPSCPAQANLVKLGLDKQKPGWYGRWSRFTRDHYEGEDE